MKTFFKNLYIRNNDKVTIKYKLVVEIFPVLIFCLLKIKVLRYYYIVFPSDANERHNSVRVPQSDTSYHFDYLITARCREKNNRRRNSCRRRIAASDRSSLTFQVLTAVKLYKYSSPSVPAVWCSRTLHYNRLWWTSSHLHSWPLHHQPTLTFAEVAPEKQLSDTMKRSRQSRNLDNVVSPFSNTHWLVILSKFFLKLFGPNSKRTRLRNQRTNNTVTIIMRIGFYTVYSQCKIKNQILYSMYFYKTLYLEKDKTLVLRE